MILGFALGCVTAVEGLSLMSCLIMVMLLFQKCTCKAGQGYKILLVNLAKPVCI